MAKLSTKIRYFENQIKSLQNRIRELELQSNKSTPVRPYSIAGGGRDGSHIRPTDLKSGLGGTYGGNLCFNDTELLLPRYGEMPDIPTVGYNSHSHSKFSGGALDINTLKLVAYDFELDEDGEWVSDEFNKHSQQYWTKTPDIKKTKLTSKVVPFTESGEREENIGFLDVEFDTRTKKFKTSAYEIDVEQTVLVKRTSEGEIETDENDKPKSSPLFHDDETKTNVVWDKGSRMWRFYAVYADIDETPAEEE